MTDPALAEQEKWLIDHGFVIEACHPRANTNYSGRFMVTEVEIRQRLEDEPEFFFPDASGLDGWCLIGDDREELIRETYDMHFNPEDYIDVSSDGVAEIVHADGSREPAPENWFEHNSGFKATRIE